MNQRWNFKSCLVLVSIAILSTGCASKWVKRPEADQIKKVAIISTYMDSRISSDYGKEADGGGTSFLRALVGKDKKDEQEQIKKDDPRRVIVTKAYQAFEKTINAIPNWQVVSYESVVRNKKYHAMFEPTQESGFMNTLMKAATRLGTAQYVTPAKLHVVPVNPSINNSQTKEYAELAKALGVDAVAAIHIKLGYNDGWISLASQTKASPMAAAELLMITSTGEVAVVTPRMTEDSFVEADGSVWISNRKLKLDDDAIKLYDEAINKVASQFKKKIMEDFANS